MIFGIVQAVVELCLNELWVYRSKNKKLTPLLGALRPIDSSARPLLLN
jgi:hypothetical protein